MEPADANQLGHKELYVQQLDLLLLAQLPEMQSVGDTLRKNFKNTHIVS